MTPRTRSTAGGQLPLQFGCTWGGKRKGAGRKPRGESSGVSHLRRDTHRNRYPLHVTVRVREGLPSLRSQSLFQCVCTQIREARQRFVRIVHFSIQSNHIHLLVEAEDRRRLTQGMKGLAVRVARRVNRLLSSRGRIVADRYHARALKTPREVRNALVYVLFNHRKHGGHSRIDPCSSAPFFTGWSEAAMVAKPRAPPHDWPVAPCETWLLRIGWKRRGALDLDATPAQSM